MILWQIVRIDLNSSCGSTTGCLQANWPVFFRMITKFTSHSCLHFHLNLFSETV